MAYIKTVHSGDPVQASEYNKIAGLANEVFYDYQQKGGPLLRVENDEVWVKNVGSTVFEPGDVVQIGGFVNSRSPNEEMLATRNDGFLLCGAEPELVSGEFGQAFGFSIDTIRQGGIGKVLLRGIIGAMVTVAATEQIGHGKFARLKIGEDQLEYNEEKGEYYIAANSSTSENKAFCALVPRIRKATPVVKNVQIVIYTVSEAGYDTVAEVQEAKDAIDTQIAVLNTRITRYRLPYQVCVISDWSNYLINVECENNDIKGTYRWDKQILIKEFVWVSDHDRPEDENGYEVMPEQGCRFGNVNPTL